MYTALIMSINIYALYSFEHIYKAHFWYNTSVTKANKILAPVRH